MKKQTSLKNLLFGLLISTTLFTTVSCKKDKALPQENQVSININANSEIEELKKFLSSSTGVSIEKIEYNEKAQQFFLDGDMMMPLDFARGHFEKSKKDGNLKPTQRRYDFIMNATAASSVVVFVRTDMPAAWLTAIDQAIANWNTTDCLIRVSRTTNAASATISMAPYYDGATTTIAFASFPNAAGNVGPTINVNTFYNTLSASQKQFAMTHEMGHCFGFTHTNQTYGAIIPGTPTTDPNSVMNASVLNWNGFTPYDYIAYGVVYPNVVGTQRFLRYYNPGNGDHFYTTNPGELGAGGSGYRFEGSAGYIFTSPQAGTVVLYRYYNPGNGDHFYTTNYAELGGGGSGYVYEGVAGYVNPSYVFGSKALYRYYNGGIGDHFYTTNYAELGGGGSGYVYEGVACYVR